MGLSVGTRLSIRVLRLRAVATGQRVSIARRKVGVLGEDLSLVSRVLLTDEPGVLHFGLLMLGNLRLAVLGFLGPKLTVLSCVLVLLGLRIHLRVAVVGHELHAGLALGLLTQELSEGLLGTLLLYSILLGRGLSEMSATNIVTMRARLGVLVIANLAILRRLLLRRLLLRPVW